MALSVEEQILLTLKILAGCEYQMGVGDHNGVNQATVSRIFHKVIASVNIVKIIKIIK